MGIASFILRKKFTHLLIPLLFFAVLATGARLELLDVEPEFFLGLVHAEDGGVVERLVATSADVEDEADLAALLVASGVTGAAPALVVVVITSAARAGDETESQ